jgi:hypothetical protein
MEDVMKNPYEEDAARFMEALSPLCAWIDQLNAELPPERIPLTRRMRKVTPDVMRRHIAGLRSGEMRPLDPSIDPNALADRIEANLARSAELKQAMQLLEQLHNALMSIMEEKLSKTFDEVMEFYHVARRAAPTSDNEALKEFVRTMNRAIGRGKRR